jgi:tRNA-dependent cyclodipeptide synthase
MKFNVSVTEVLPPRSWSPDRRVESALLGVSVANPNFRGRRLEALLHWAASHASRCLVLIGDDLYGISAQVKRELGGLNSAATTSATDRQISEVLAAIKKFSPRTFEVIRWSELHSEKAPFRTQLDDLFEQDRAFRRTVLETAREYLHKRGRSSSAGLEALCIEYVLEELAGLATIVARGTNVEFYPGPELRVLRSVSNGEHPGVPEPLLRRVNVSLEIRREDREE